MYKKFAFMLCLFLMLSGMFTVHAKDADINQELPEDVLHMTIEELQEKQEEDYTEEALFSVTKTQEVSSPERMVAYDVLVNEDAVFLDEESLEILCRIVEAEAGTEDEEGRMLVANVVLNRVESRRFPDTVKGVVFQQGGGKYQFSPVATGSYYHVNVSEKTREAVEKVLRGEDSSQGALFFVNRYAAKTENMNWFDAKCTFLFAHGRHEFFS